jgi:hypothetical protein
MQLHVDSPRESGRAVMTEQRDADSIHGNPVGAGDDDA